MGLFVGDALAMPVHWYYDRRALRRDYGRVTGYMAPRNPHPDSILWRSAYRPLNAKADILHDQAEYWGRRGVHYHQFLRAGENTVNLKLCGQLIDSLNARGAYDVEDYLVRYIAFMTQEGRHRDTYVEECHRHFFDQYARGCPPTACGEVEKHIGGLVGLVPIVVFCHDHPREARRAALQHMHLTHTGPRMDAAAELLIGLLLELLDGGDLRQGLVSAIRRGDNRLLPPQLLDWLDEPDERVIGRRLSTACYVEDAVPAVMFLALKYHDQPDEALVVNTNLGGDNAHRGAVLGALLGAARGVKSFPARWREGLLEPPADMDPFGPAPVPDGVYQG